MSGPKPTDTLTDTRLNGMLYLRRNASPFKPAKAGRSYGNAFSQFTGGYLMQWDDHGTYLYALTPLGEEVVDWLLAVRDEKRAEARAAEEGK